MVAINIGGPGKIDISRTPEQDEQYQAMQTAASEAPAGPTRFIGADGKMYDVPASSYKLAIDSGWRPAEQKEIQREDTINERVKNTGQLEGGIKNFANEASMGILNYISNKNVGPEQAAIDEEVRNRVAERDPITHYGTSAAGFLLPLAIPGVGEAGLAAKGAVLGERVVARGAEELAARTIEKAGAEVVTQAAEASLTRKIAATAAQYATEGAVYSAPKAAVQVAYGDPEQAAETMLWGIGLSGLGGAAVGGAGAAIKSVGELTGSLQSKLLEKQANGLTIADQVGATHLGFTPKQMKALGSDKIGRFVERADQLGVLQSGNKIKAAEGILETSGEKIREHLTTLENHLSDPDIAKLVSSPRDAADEIMNTALKDFPGIATMETKSGLFKELNKIVSDVGGGGIDPSFNKLQELRDEMSEAGKDAFHKKATPTAELYKMTDGIIKKHLEQSAEKVYAAGVEPTQFADYMQNKFDYHMASEMLLNKNEFKYGPKLPTSLAAIIGHGSSVTNLLGGVALGHPLAATAVVGAKLAINNLLQNEALMGKGISVVRKIAKDPASTPIIGGLLAKEGQSALTRHLDSIPELLQSAPSKAVALGATNAVATFLGDEAKGLSKEQQFKRVTNRLSALSTDTTTADQVGHISSAFSGTSVQLASLVAQKKLNAISYLASQLPKNPNGPTPFQKDDWKPSKQDQMIFERKLGIVMNPMAIWSHIQDHSVTQADVETLRAVYPKIYNAMVEKTAEAAYDPRIGNVNHQRRLAVSSFTGSPMDASIKNIANIQAAIKAPQNKTASISKPSSHPKMDRAPTLMTDVQRRTSGKRP